jgi:uncharacterized membrane protein
VIILLAGLLIFFSTHSIRIGVPVWRDRQIARYGDRNWRSTYSVVSVLGLVLIILGFSRVRWTTPILWTPPLWAPYVTAAALLLAFVLNAASGVPGNRIRGIVRHPMRRALGGRTSPCERAPRRSSALRVLPRLGSDRF